MSVSVLAIGAHPDDVEVGVGATVHKLTSSGESVAILDLTEGELGSRGTVNDRRREATQAGAVLGVATRLNAGLPDGGIADTEAQRARVISVIRSLRPRLILAPMREDRHPDHEAAHVLTRNANYFSGLTKLKVEGTPYRCPMLLFYSVYRDAEQPQFIVDITQHFNIKRQALQAYASQFFNPGFQGPETFVSSKAFWEGIEKRAAYWGLQIGAAYGEPLFADGPIGVAIPPGLENPV